jgi:Leucine-rich repeat (LRR) protein
MSYNIKDYLNSLDDDVTEIDVANKNLTNLPDLTRFKKLEILRCDNNRLTSLPPLPNNLQKLYCYCNQLKSLPILPNNLQILNCIKNKLSLLPELPNNLQKLSCSDNKLISFPALPTNLQELRCYDNQLTSLPSLPNSLTLLHCSYNRLHLLPDLPNNLQKLYYNHNPIYSIIGGDNNINNARLRLLKLNKIKDVCYALKFKNKFRKWLWERVRLPKIQKLYHPENLMSMLTDEEKDLDEVLKEWIKTN